MQWWVQSAADTAPLGAASRVSRVEVVLAHTVDLHRVGVSRQVRIGVLQEQAVANSASSWRGEGVGASILSFAAGCVHVHIDL